MHDPPYGRDVAQAWLDIDDRGRLQIGLRRVIRAWIRAADDAVLRSISAIRIDMPWPVKGPVLAIIALRPCARGHTTGSRQPCGHANDSTEPQHAATLRPDHSVILLPQMTWWHVNRAVPPKYGSDGVEVLLGRYRFRFARRIFAPWAGPQPQRHVERDRAAPTADDLKTFGVIIRLRPPPHLGDIRPHG